MLDTHACVFLLAAPRKLGANARRALERVESGRDAAWVPATVVAEIVLLHELGRIRIGLPQLRETFDSVPGLRFLPLDLHQLDQFVSLTAVGRDTISVALPKNAFSGRRSALSTHCACREASILRSG